MGQDPHFPWYLSSSKDSKADRRISSFTTLLPQKHRMRVKDSGMSERTLPPKKSRAGFEKEKEVNGDKKETEDESDEEYVNIFETTVVEGKRKHFVPKGNQILDEWLDSHLEEKEGYKTSFTALYSCYLNLCMEKSINNALEEHAFVKFVKGKFPDGHATREDSSLKSKLKVIKKEAKPHKPSGPKMSKAIIQEAFTDLEFPREGVMFNALKRHMIPKHPALRLDLRPNRLLHGLNMGLRNGYIELLKGIGKSGRYRWYDAEADKREEEEDQERRKKKREEAKAAKEGAAKEDETTDESKEKDSEKKEGDETGDQGDDGDEGEKEEPKKRLRKRKAKSTEDKKKSKAKKKKKARKPSRSYIVHSDPQRIEETFPLAMTFMAEPKKASFNAIEKYIDKNYGIDVKTDKLIKTLELMEEKGYLEKTTGSGRGSYQLTLDEFDPTDDDDLIGKIVNAVMASVHPKECSVRSLKGYVAEFYPVFEVNEKPYKFKMALERAQRKDIIRQVTGYGMTGSYQLVDHFIPTPVILAGKDTSEDYETDNDDISSDEGVISDEKEVDLSLFMDAYKPRPTKRRGKAREVQKSGFNPNQAYLDAQLRQEAARRMSQEQSRQRKRSQAKKDSKKKLIRTPKKRRYEESSEEEEEEEQEEEEQSDSGEEEEDSTYGSEAGEKYRPRPSASRGGTPRKAPVPRSKAPKRQSPAKKKAKKVSTKASKAEEREPSRKKAAKKPSPKKATGGKKAKKSKRRK